jgi:hypothetical protein
MMNSRPNPADFDDESLIRVFVRLRAEKNTSGQKFIYGKVQNNSSYKLPAGILVPNSEKKKIMLDITNDSKIFLSTMIDQDIEMQVESRLIDSDTLVYFDRTSCAPIDYQEYEERYKHYVKACKLRTRIVHGLKSVVPKCILSSPLVLSNNDCSFESGNKRPRLLDFGEAY